MTDRTESLLAELVELQRRSLANQERALAMQDQSIAMQTDGLTRYNRNIRIVWILVAFVMTGIFTLIVLPLL